MAFDLYPYQINAINQIRGLFKKGIKRVILCSPTGSGKTVTFAKMCMDTLMKGKRVMIICDRRELVQQAKDKLIANGLQPVVIMAGEPYMQHNCYVASVDTLKRRSLPQVDLIVIDEAHKSTFDKIIDLYPDTFIIGATATPLSTFKNNLSLRYGGMVNCVTIGELLDQKYLVPAVTFGAKQDLSGVKTKGQDYDDGALFDYFNKQLLYDGVIDNYIKFAKGTKAIVFNVNVEHSKRMTEEFNRRGIISFHIDGTTPRAERRRILEDYRAGRFMVLNNCSIYTTGFDEPSIETVIVNRATKSLPLWLQMAGRGSRTYPGKEHFNLIDMGSNVYVHGFWQDEREWSLIPKQKRKGDNAAPVKMCPKCEAIIHASLAVCPECEHVIPRKEKELLQAEFGVIEKVFIPPHLRKPWDQMNDQELEEYCKLKKWKRGWIYHQKKRRQSKHVM